MALTLEEIRRRLLKEDERKKTFTDNAVYPFWNIKEGSSATVRFLPDGNDNNPFFWVEKLTINLPFSGTTEDENTPIVVKVPCVEMFDMKCPILKEVREWYKEGDPELEEMAKKYWKKVSYIFQGFVVQSPFEEENVPENPIRRFVLNRSLFNIIKASIMDPEMESLPVDYEEGRDFRISKTLKGGKYADYSTSKWSIKTRPLSDEELKAIEKFGLFNLSDFLPRKPDEEDLNDIYDMFIASVNGELFNVEKWKRFMKGSNDSSYSSTNDKTKSTQERKVSSKKETSVSDDDFDDVEDDEENVIVKANTDEEPSFDMKDEDEDESEAVIKKLKSRSLTSSQVKTKTSADDILARLKSRISD